MIGKCWYTMNSRQIRGNFSRSRAWRQMNLKVCCLLLKKHTWKSILRQRQWRGRLEKGKLEPVAKDGLKASNRNCCLRWSIRKATRFNRSCENCLGSAREERMSGYIDFCRFWNKPWTILEFYQNEIQRSSKPKRQIRKMRQIQSLMVPKGVAQGRKMLKNRLSTTAARRKSIVTRMWSLRLPRENEYLISAKPIRAKRMIRRLQIHRRFLTQSILPYTKTQVFKDMSLK